MKISMRNTFNLKYKDGFILKDLSFDFYELIYLVNGNGRTSINNQSYPYTGHMVCFTQPGDVRHHFTTKSSDYYCVRFFSKNIAPSLESGLYKIYSSDVMDLFKKIFAESIEKNIHYHEVCNLNISELLLKLSRLQTTSSEDEAMLQLIREIDASPTFDRSIHEMADTVSYSYDHFRHKFKEITGQPPTTYIIGKRVEHACDLLAETNKSCTVIADICGFSTSAQLSSQFKKHIGVTPIAYRNSYLGLK